ncbi:glycosyltransferase [Bacillus alkalicellulosilyticus]|uniref:glycosyltransferase family protein n=1 Tax=Alkalihalobacterium alkalicellulosilyticum TaxID=1912214 RepID=UPI00099809FA|nr:glycosyltransferase [Bacillus alkalicellulosilyticus]
MYNGVKEKINLLFITKDWSQGLERNTYYLEEELKNLTNLTVSDKDGDLCSIVKSLATQPDFILLNDIRPSRSPSITGISQCNIPIGMIMHDLHYKKELRKQFIKENNIQYLFTHYRDMFIKWYPEFHNRMIWFPHYVNTNLFKDYQLEKEIDLLMMGCTYPNIYPLRDKIYQTFKADKRFLLHEHPGYNHSSYSDKKFLVGERYAKELNRAKIFFTCDSIYRYPIMKYYEVLASNTLLLAPHSPELADLGFIPGTNFVSITEDNFEKKANYHLKHYKTLGKKIAEEGYKMVRKKHSVKKRANQLHSAILSIVQERRRTE